MTRLVLLRHGQTDWNVERRFQGQTDIGLNDVGRAQAAAAAPHVARERPDLIVSSPLGRALSTADHVAAQTGQENVTDPRLVEINVGTWAGLTADEMQRRDPDFSRTSRSGGDFRRSATGETADEVGLRMRMALLDIACRFEGGTVLVVSHGLAIRMGVGYLMGWGYEQTCQLGIMGNCGWSVLDHHPDRGWRLEAYNRQAPAVPAT